DNPAIMLNALLLLIAVLGVSQQESLPIPKNSVKLLATEAGKTDLIPSSRFYKAILNNQGKDRIFLNAVQMPVGYSGNGCFFACSLRIWDTKNGSWTTHRLYSFYDARATPRIVQVEVAPGETLDVCDGLYPSQKGRAGDCARFALSPERGQEPVFFSN